MPKLIFLHFLVEIFTKCTVPLNQGERSLSNLIVSNNNSSLTKLWCRFIVQILPE